MNQLVNGRHRPLSHPVVQARSHAALAREIASGLSASEIATMHDRIDDIARLVRMLPEQPLTPPQADRLRIIARELLRRAR
jgi:hypothetical protein